MNAHRGTSRVASTLALTGLLVTGLAATALASTDAHDYPTNTPVTTGQSLHIVNGINTAAGVAAKLARLG